MQIKVKAKEFLEVLNKIKHIAKPDKTCPVLSCGIFETIGNGVQITASSLISYAIVTAPAEIIEPGKCLIEIGKLATILATLNGDVIIEQKDAAIWIKCGNTKCRFEKQSLAQYPENLLNMKDVQCSFEMSCSGLIEGIEKTKNFTSNFATHILRGINLKTENNMAKFAATDGNRLAYVIKTYKENMKNSTEAGEEGRRGGKASDENIKSLMKIDEEGKKADVCCDIIIPLDAAANLLPLIIPDGDVEISINESVCKFDIKSDQGNIIFCTRLIEGQFPKVEQLIPKESAISFSLNKEELKNVLERIGVVECKEDQFRVMFSIKGAIATVEAKDYKCNDVLTLSGKNGEDISYILNRLFLDEVLKVISTDTVTFNLNSPRSPVLFSDMEHKYMIMPMA